MAKVNLAEIQKEVIAKKESISVQEIIGPDGKTYYQDPISKDVYTNKDEAVQALSDYLRRENLRKQGLDEYGRTPELIALSERKAELLKDKAELLKKVQKIDDQIRNLKPEDFKVSKKAK